jgi:hypothetical protein
MNNSTTPHTPASTADTAGPAAAITPSCAGRRGVRVISASPPSRNSRTLRTGIPRRSATTQWPSSWASTDAPSRIANAAASRIEIVAVAAGRNRSTSGA